MASILTIPLCVVFFKFVPKSNMPHLDHTEVITKIEWNKNIHIDENKKRTDILLQSINDLILETATYVGNRQYLLEEEENISISEVEIYIKSSSSKNISEIKQKINTWNWQEYPKSLVSFSPVKNIFEKKFDTNEPDFITQLTTKNRQYKPLATDIKQIKDKIAKETGVVATDIAFEE